MIDRYAYILKNNSKKGNIKLILLFKMMIYIEGR